MRAHELIVAGAAPRPCDPLLAREPEARGPIILHPRRGPSQTDQVDEGGDETAVDGFLWPSWITAGVLSVVIGTASWLRHEGFWTGFDLAIFDQAAWQLANGDTHISIIDRHVLADHLSPVILVFGALYRVAETPAWLLGAQGLAFGATVLASRSLALAIGASPRLGVALSACSAPLLSAAMFDFHPSTLAVPFVAWMLVFALEGRLSLSVLAAVGVVACRADLALVVAAVALVGRREVRSALVVVAAVAAGLAAVVPGLFGPTNGWAPHFGHLGDSPVAAVLQPWRALAHLATTGALWPLVVWVLAAGCLVLGNLRWMAALALAGAPVLLSAWDGTSLPWYHYGAPMVPLAVGGTLDSLDASWARADGIRRMLVVGPVLALAFASPLSPGAPRQNQVWAITSGNEPDVISALLDQVPADAAVSADQWFLPHLSHRPDLMLFPMPFAEPQGYFAPGSTPPLDQYGPNAAEVVIAPRGWRPIVPDSYRLEDERGGWLLFRLG